MSARERLYDSGIFEVENPEIPVVSVGNLTVGGTGKTPFAAWLASRLAKSAQPAVALRGYGGDEHEVHRRLNPEIPVVVNANRVAAIRVAKAQGSDVAVLDDAFQHRRIARTGDILLLSAEQLMRPLRLLPAGPWREPLSAAGRADVLVITRKSAGSADAQRAREKLQRLMPGAPIATVHLAPHALVSAVDDESLPLSHLRGASVIAFAAIGEPGVFARQLEQLGARVSLVAFRDHHAYSAADLRKLASRVPADGFALCTLKDAVKVASRWPASSRLWYVSQQLVVEQGEEHLERLLARVLAARSATTIPAG
jgi:tetraacyldisaccharide 4'-kinase